MSKNKPASPAEAARLMRLAANASITVAIVLMTAKTGAWLATESVSMLSTLLDSLLDALASMINLLAVRYALQPADRMHRFGHGKAEPLASLAQAGFICGSAAILLFQAAERFLHPRPIHDVNAGYAVMIFSIILTTGLVILQNHTVRRTESVAIRGDSLHYKTDLLINCGVILSLFLYWRLGWVMIDPLFAIIIAVYIVSGAKDIWRNALDLLLDRELPEADRQRIKDIVMAHPGALGMHDLRTRSSGAQRFIQFHLEMSPKITLCAAHEITEAVIAKLEAAFPGAELIVHEDPAGIAEKRAVFR